MNLSSKYGMLRSWLIYYAKPFNRFRLKSFYSQFIKKSDLVFDIGAHLGNRSRAFLDLGAKVIAVEPQPDCLHFLKNKLGKSSDFILIEGVVSNHIGEISFYINSTSPTISTARNDQWQQEINKLSFLKPKWTKEIKVQALTLDDMIQKYGLPTYCKIDTEGYELEVLQGLSQLIPCISIEYLAFDKERIVKCIQKIGTLGRYEVNFSPGESQKWLWKEWKPAAELSDIICQNKLKHQFGDLFFRSVGG